METSSPKAAFEEPILPDVLPLVHHRDKLAPIVEAASGPSVETSLACVSKRVAEKVGLGQEEVERILTALQKLDKTKYRMGLGLNHFMQAVAENIETAAKESGD